MINVLTANSGLACKTASSRGDLSTVIRRHGLYRRAGELGSKGQSIGSQLKLEISSLDVNVRLNWNTGTSAFNTISGTGKETLHVTDVVALLLSKNPALSYDDVRAVIATATEKPSKRPATLAAALPTSRSRTTSSATAASTP